MPASGMSLIIVINFTKPTVCFELIILTSMMAAMMKKNKAARIHPLANIGNKTASESARIFIRAALPITPQPNVYSQLIIYPENFQNAFST